MPDARWVEVVKEFRFEAAHVLPRHPGKCSRLHGHSWLLRVGVTGLVNPETGFVVDFFDLKGLVQPYVDKWDHSFLGAGRAEVFQRNPNGGFDFDEQFEQSVTEGFYPTSENLVTFLVSELQPIVRTLAGLRPETGPAEGPFLSLVEIGETCTSRAIWRPDNERRRR